MAIQKGGTLTIYFNEDTLPVLEKLEAIKEEKGVSMSKLVGMALETYLKVYEAEQKVAKKKA